ncbi:hypothetical protein CVT26_009213 [Gymnopilus dilepis]|uniref:Uncharacterized protein n=1 Tax=Gymnopilus dilepis TaxID=231916 RepID=A0A409WZJ5_9AGAR|nr:hypothetical protein CVT26_009213 [Gymnopilus dilepis]
MPSTISRAIDQFLQDIACLPTNLSMDEALQKALEAERHIRLLFGSDPHNPLLQDLYLGLVDVFRLDPAVRRARARVILDRQELPQKYIFPVKALYRRPNLMPSTVPDIKAFRKHWELFTHGALSKMRPKDWQNVVAAGGSVLACLAPPRPAIPARDLQKIYQAEPYAASDIDLFIWGLSPEEAKRKMEDIFDAVCASVRFDEVVCVRKAHVLSIHASYPTRPIQIILRLYQSPAEILAGFDVDAACCAYDGDQVWVNPRSLAAIIRQANTIDITRRSPSYEIRLAKYAERHYEVYLPTLERSSLDPSIYTRGLQAYPQGLARLLVLERAFSNPWWYSKLQYPRTRIIERRHRPQYDIGPRDLPSQDPRILISSNYDRRLEMAKVPYGPKWNARSIREIISRRLLTTLFAGVTGIFFSQELWRSVSDQFVLNVNMPMEDALISTFAAL